MKLSKRIPAIILFILFVTVLSDDNKPLKKLLIGKWKMQQVVQGGEDVTGYHNPYQERWILFNEDNSFSSEGKPYSRNTGEWQLDTKNNELFLKNDSKSRNDSYWIISFPENDKMIWKGFRSEYTKDFEIYYLREK